MSKGKVVGLFQIADAGVVVCFVLFPTEIDVLFRCICGIDAGWNFYQTFVSRPSVSWLRGKLTGSEGQR